MDERWKGMKPVAWGQTLNEAQLTATIYEGLCGLNKSMKKEEVEK
jgi:glycerol-3-phosphate dehydrogenase